MNSTLRTLCIASTCMLLLALGAMPYGYYILLKIAVCVTFVTLAIALKEAGAGGLMLVAWAFAALYNPIVRIPFSKEVWSVINLITIAAVWISYRKAGASEKTGQ